jgi:hypothetical protein
MGKECAGLLPRGKLKVGIFSIGPTPNVLAKLQHFHFRKITKFIVIMDLDT